MLNARSIQGISILIIGTFLAVWLGVSIVTNQIETLLQVVVAVTLITCLFLGRKIWLLIPFMAALNIQLRLPGQPDSLLFGQILFLGFSTLLLLMRKLPFQFYWTELEFWGFVLTLLIMQVYVRNPVGVNLFGGNTVGGKPYAIYLIGMASAMILAGLIVPSSQLKWILRLSIIGGMLSTSLAIIGNFVPAIGYYIGSYVSSDDGGYDKSVDMADTGASTRVDFLVQFAQSLSLWISSFISPLKACLRPLWAFLVGLAFISAMMGGYRNGVMIVGLTFIIGIAYRSGLSSFMVSMFAAIGAIALLAAVNLLYPLQPNIQRSLTFLPGTWEQRYKEDAKSSSEWRFLIWREALFTDKWIQNKWLGDGLGFSAAEFVAQQNIRQGSRVGLSGLDAQRENIMANGDYHSGPVSTIRTIGYIGLIIFIIAQTRLAIHAHRQIIRSRGSEWYPLALLLGIPLISGPIFFVFVFGDFKRGAAAFLISCGMIRLLENNLPLPAFVKRTPAIRMLPSNKNTNRFSGGFQKD